MKQANRYAALRARGIPLSDTRLPAAAEDFRKVVRNSLLVGEKDRQKNRRLGLFLLAATIFSAAALFSLGIRMEMRRLDYRIGRLAQTKMGLEEQLRILRGEVSQLQSMERIDRTARQSLGLVLPAPGQVVYVYPAADSGTPTPPPVPAGGTTGASH